MAMCGLNLWHRWMHKIATENILLERLEILPIDKSSAFPPCCMQGSLSTHVPSTLVPTSKIAGNENDSWKVGKHLVEMEKHA